MGGDAGLDVETAYSAPIESKPRDAEFLQRCYDMVSSSEAPPTMLDVGCGDCVQAARFFAKRGAKVTGVDIGAAVCQKARLVCRDHGLEDVQILQDDMLTLCRLPCDLKFRVVSSFYSLHHVDPAKVEALIETLAARLEPGGLLMVAALTDMRPEVEDAGGSAAAKAQLVESTGRGKRKRDDMSTTAEPFGVRISTALRSMHRFFASVDAMEAACHRCGLSQFNASHRHEVYRNEFPVVRLYFTAVRGARPGRRPG